jgi:hypothetical protein
MCSIIINREISNTEIIAYSVKVKLNSKYKSIFYGGTTYRLNKTYKAVKGRLDDEIDYIVASGYFHLFSNLISARTFRREILNNVDHISSLVILKVKIPKNTKIVNGKISRHFYGGGLHTVCAELIIFKEEVK